MPKSHTLQSGECLQTLARDNGLHDGKTIYDFGDNAPLRSQRQAPAEVMKGDAVVIPDPVAKTVSRATDAVHRFRVLGPEAMLRLEVHDDFGQPIASQPFELHMDGQVVEGSTTGAGLIEQPVPLGVTEATLVVYATGDKKQGHWCWQVRVADLDPPETVTGCWARLSNLGYWSTLDPPPDDGGTGPGSDPDQMSRDPLVLAIRAFQFDEQLDVSGQIDDPTRARLVERHGI